MEQLNRLYYIFILSLIFSLLIINFISNNIKNNKDLIQLFILLILICYIIIILIIFVSIIMLLFLRNIDNKDYNNLINDSINYFSDLFLKNNFYVTFFISIILNLILLLILYLKLFKTIPEYQKLNSKDKIPNNKKYIIFFSILFLIMITLSMILIRFPLNSKFTDEQKINLFIDYSIYILCFIFYCFILNFYITRNIDKNIKNILSILIYILLLTIINRSNINKTTKLIYYISLTIILFILFFIDKIINKY